MTDNLHVQFALTSTVAAYLIRLGESVPEEVLTEPDAVCCFAATSVMYGANHPRGVSQQLLAVSDLRKPSTDLTVATLHAMAKDALEKLLEQLRAYPAEATRQQFKAINSFDIEAFVNHEVRLMEKSA